MSMIRSIRIYITERCNANCPTCFNKQSRSTSELPYDKFCEICNMFVENNVQHLKIMGGEPTLHHDFYRMVEYAQSKFAYVHIFTNAINDIISNVQLREEDSIVYNFNFSKSLTFSKLLPNQPGKRALEIQINSSTDEERLLLEINRIYMLLPQKVICVLTLDCTENIFLEREVLVKKYIRIWKYCEQKSIPLYQDHKIPLCWIYGTEVPIIHEKKSICNIECAGLIDSNGNLKHCNQFPNELINIYDNGKLLPYKIICNHLKLAHNKIEQKALEKICTTCVLYGKNCNGGCFISKDNITRDDIINCSNFPK